jgi:Dolichyl-phosphate-mannose-protein mannosyltransferase
MPTAETPRRWAWPALGAVLAVGLGLRLWGIRQGLPYAYNVDEADHFLPRAVAMFAHGLNPHYFVNPPAFTYLLHFLLALVYGGGSGVQHAVALHPTAVYTLARVAAAVLGVAALWLLYLTGTRLFGRGVGVLAAAIEAVAFLPVFYAHLALNDVPTLAPLTLSLLGTAGVLRSGRTRDYVLAGVGLGLACATKYTAGIAVVPFAAAVAARYLNGEAGAARRAIRGIALTAALALLAFVIANPYAVLDFQRFHRDIIHQSTLSSEAQGKLGAPRHGGLLYYLWSLTWGLGWAPALAALAGALTVWRSRRAVGWVLVPAALLFLAFMGLQGRYFGRWLLPIFPILCLLAAFFTLRAADALARLVVRRRRGRPRSSSHLSGLAVPPSVLARRSRSPARWRVALVTLFAAVLLAQGLIYSVHSGLVLSRADTRNLTRAWMVAHIPAGTPIVVEPVAPDAWGRRWTKYPSELLRVTPAGTLIGNPTQLVTIEEYERTLAPTLLAYYRSTGYCFIVSGTTQSGRAFADPKAVPAAIAYYRALAAQGEVVYRASPYARGHGPVPFGFDWSFDYYPLAYHRPGPAMTVYRLHGGRCGR